MKFGKFSNFIQRTYILWMVVVGILVLLMNYNARHMFDVIVDYLDLRDIVLAGGNPAMAIRRGTPTFPMWGYGIFLIPTENMAVVLVVQNILAILSYWIFMRIVDRERMITAQMSVFVKLFMIGSLSWFAMQSWIWPYGLAINFFMLSVILLIQEVTSGKPRPGFLLLSGVLFGIDLNFRSDYLLMPIGLFILSLWFLRLSWRHLLMMGLWILSIYMCLVPWGMYTKKVTGRFLWTSTNGGMYWFIGWGMNPHNKWGITTFDGDPKLHQTIDDHFGGHRSYADPEVDRYLKSWMSDAIRHNPGEYVKKCGWALVKMITEGTYSGRFFLQDNLSLGDCIADYKTHLRDLATRPLWFLRSFKIRAIRVGLQAVSRLTNLVLIALSFLLLPFTIYTALRSKNIFFTFILASICYQSLINILLVQKADNTTMMYFFHVLNVIWGVSIFIQKYCSQSPEKMSVLVS